MKTKVDTIDLEIQHTDGACPICESTTTYTSFKNVESNTNIQVCGECYMVYQPTIYGINYYDIECSTTRVSDPKKHSSDVANYILDFCKPSKNINSILEIGASSTQILSNMKKYFIKSNIKMCGVNLPIQNKTKIKNLKIKMSFSTCIDKRNKDECLRELTIIPFGEAFKYDFIYCRHTLEHFENPKQAVKNTHNLLSLNGTAFFEVPSFLWTEVNGVSTYDLEHLSYFTKNTLTKLFSDEGFKIIKIKESKYWGNIKILVRKLKRNENKDSYTLINSIRWKWFYKLMQPFYVAIKNNTKIRANS